MESSKKQMLIVVLFLVAFLTLIGVGVYFYVQEHEDATSSASQALSVSPEVAFTDSGGQVIDLSQFSNQIRVINSWATWSPFSKEELPMLEELAKAYAGKEVAVLAINRKESAVFANAYLETLGVFPNLKIVFDPADTFFTKIEGFAMPETLIYDDQGNVSSHFRGVVDYETLAGEIDKLLQK